MDPECGRLPDSPLRVLLCRYQLPFLAALWNPVWSQKCDHSQSKHIKRKQMELQDQAHKRFVSQLPIWQPLTNVRMENPCLSAEFFLQRNPICDNKLLIFCSPSIIAIDGKHFRISKLKTLQL